MGWTLGALAAALILGLAFLWMSHSDNRTASSPKETTGQIDRAPGRPISATPNTTTPQNDPTKPAPQ